jgi:hypothetical protein
MAITLDATSNNAGQVSDDSDADSSSINYSNPTTYLDWAYGWLNYLGAPATSPNDPRVKLIESWEQAEASEAQDFGPDPGKEPSTGTHNPLDVEYSSKYWTSLPGQGEWNSEGVSTFPNAEEGYEATTNFFNVGVDKPIITALKNPNATDDQLESAMRGGAFETSDVQTLANQDYISNILTVFQGGVAQEGPPNPNPISASVVQSPSYGSDPEGIKEAGTIGQILIQLDFILNPTHTIKSPDLVESILTLGIANAVEGTEELAMIIATVIFRAFFVLGFLALLWIGLQDLTGKRAGTVAHVAGAPIRAVTGTTNTAARFFGTPIQRRRESRLETTAERGERALTERTTGREERIKLGRSQMAATTRRQGKSIRHSARQLYLKTYGEYPEDAGYRWDARQQRFV